MLTSQVSAVVDARCGTVSSCREEVDELQSALSSGSVDCALAMASKSAGQDSRISSVVSLCHAC